MQNEKLLKWINEKNMNDIYQCSYCKYIKKLRAWEMKKVKVFWKVLKKSCHQQKLMWIRSSFKTWILLRSFGFFAKENTCTTLVTQPMLQHRPNRTELRLMDSYILYIFKIAPNLYNNNHLMMNMWLNQLTNINKKLHMREKS